jgi:dipeptidyl aminopeptidase/acylaminoacyl peptidase
MPATLPYGSWPSPISAELLAQRVVSLTAAAADRDASWWLELRPAEGGRNVLVRQLHGGQPEDVTPEPFNVRTLAHEYGGGAFCVRDGAVWFSNFDDQRLYWQIPPEDPVPITPEPAAERADRYADADLTPDGRFLYCVRERHTGDGEPVNEIVRVPADGATAPVEVAAGHDFCSTPRVSPDGRRLAWLVWDHPNLPWDGTELWVADITGDGDLAGQRRVLGGSDESVFQPSWSPDGVLHAVSDRSGWWNLYRLDGDEPVALHRAEAEFGFPQWLFGLATYAFLDDGTIACIVHDGAVARLHLLHPGGGLEDAGLRWRSFLPPVLSSNGRRLLFVASSPTHPASVVSWDPATGRDDLLRRSFDVDLEPELISVPEPITFPTAGGGRSHGLYYPPNNPAAGAPDGEQPPLLVNVHGGPTAMADAALRLAVQFWTSRGFAVCDLNYRGSTGYGRAYRDALKGQWGVADVEDAAAAARYLAEAGRADADRLAIRGGSAGGYTTLCALAFDEVFHAGVSHFGVTDLRPFVTDTHKFEARYLDSLVGPWPEAEEAYSQRSPAEHAGQIDRPVLLLQGLEDAIVPPSQAERMLEGLRATGTPHAYIAFEGEQHGWRKAGTIVRAHEAELAFYGQVFGFTPADDVGPVL